jgi:hypothetical protein
MWVNDEGKLNGSEMNLMGTILWAHSYGWTDVICGDIVLTGVADDEGYTQGLTDEDIEALLEVIGN